MRPADRSQLRRRPRIDRWAAVVSISSIATIAALSRSSELLVAGLVVAAMAWGALPQTIDAFWGGRPGPGTPPAAPGSVTVIVHGDGQQLELVRASAMAAAAAAPTIVVTGTDRSGDARVGRDLSAANPPMAVVAGQTLEHALNHAISSIETDAFIMVAAGSFVDVAAARAAAGAVHRGAGWVIGRSQVFNRDAFGPVGREHADARRRSAARSAGVVLWEPDATIVSTQLAREHPFQPERPWGAVLRSAAADGTVGRNDDTVLAITAEPVGADSYWRASVLRHRRAAADLAGAARTQHHRPRLLAGGLLVRELGGLSLTLWLLTPWLMTTRDEFAFRCTPPLLFALWMAPAMLRWYSERRTHGVPLHPVDDVLAVGFDAPGSVLALSAALTGRVRPTRLRLPRQPLMVASVAFGAITLVPLFAGGTTASRSLAAGLALAELAVLFMLAMRAVFQWTWARAAYRVRVRLPVWIGGQPATTVDISPAGLAVEGELDALAPGSEHDVSIHLDDGSVLVARGTIAGRERRRTDVAGISLHVLAGDQARWNVQLACAAAASISANAHRPAGADPPIATRSRPPLPLARRVVSVTAAALVAIAATVAAAALCLIVIGYRPLIVRSASMEPALGVGDVVVVEDVHPDQLNVGDIATIGEIATPGESLTHRVQTVSVRSGVVTLTTQGDANQTTETFEIGTDALVGRVVWRLPHIGNGIAWAGTSAARVTVAVAGTCIALGLLVRSRRRYSSS